MGLVILAGLSYWKDRNMGITREIASFITFFIGVFVAFEEFYLSAFLTILTTFILVLRTKLEGLAMRLEEEDLIAILKFFTISAVILPIVPDREVIKGFNPSEAWKVVILASTVDFIGYFLLKYKGAKSLIITALVGGLASSTAVTIAFSELSRKFPRYSSLLFFAIILSWQVMFIRLIFYSFIVFKGLLIYTIQNLLPYFITLLIFAFVVYLKSEKENIEEKNVSLKNPYSLTQAFTFGFLYSAISIVSVYLKDFLGDKGIYILSLVSGIMDIDAITLLLSRLAKEETITVGVASIGILLAASSNNIFKSFYAIIFGSKKLRLYFTFPLFFTFIYLLLILFFQFS
ncbi:MAG: MgtC/SapB family protein [Aquifex sp.]|nr:MAG: MgtC/SapB family protein [Aquifex sp.]